MTDPAVPAPSLDAAQLAAIFAAVPTATFAIAVPGGAVLAANEAFGRLVGLPADAILGAIPPYPWATADAPIVAGRIETEYVAADGRAIPVELEVAEARDERGDCFALVGAAHDLSRKRLLDQQLVESGRMAAVGELAAGVAHEVNNPLFAILGLTEFLVKDIEPGSKAAERLELIRQSGEEIKEIVRALLDFARESAHERQLVPLAAVARQSVTLMRRTNAHKGVELVLTADDSNALVWASPNQLKQIFMNLMTNARQAMPEGGTVWIDVRREGDYAVATVADDGPGVPADVSGRIFEPFFTTKGTPLGTGLGLSSSLGIAEAHGGSLTLETGRARGAAFMLRLPIVDEGDA